MSRSGNGDLVPGGVVVVSINARDVRRSSDGSRTVRCIGDSSGNFALINPGSLDQAKGLQHVVLVRIVTIGHARNGKAIGSLRSIGRRNDGSINAGRFQIGLYLRQA